MTNEQIWEISYLWRTGFDTYDIAKALAIKESDVETTLFRHVFKFKRRRSA